RDTRADDHSTTPLPQLSRFLEPLLALPAPSLAHSPFLPKRRRRRYCARVGVRNTPFEVFVLVSTSVSGGAPALHSPAGNQMLVAVSTMKKTITTSLTIHEFVFIQSRTLGNSSRPRWPSRITIRAGVARKMSVSAMKPRQCHHGSL